MPDTLVNVRIAKLVEGGQGLGELPDGKKVFVWNALLGETVGVRLQRQRHSYAEGVAETIIDPSPQRVVPVEPNYLATSPWQIMTFAAENDAKQQIAKDIFAQAKVAIPKSFKMTAALEAPDGMRPSGDEAERLAGVAYRYRNKMEYSFWGDDDGLHLALYHRGSHGKQIVTGSALAMPGIDTAANALCAQLNALGMRAGDMKTIILRASQEGDVVASLFVKREDFPELALPKELKGLRVYYSNPKSPASVRTRLLQELGTVILTDILLGNPFAYDGDSFFQVNIPVYEQALRSIQHWAASEELVDMYAGVGSIGLSVASHSVYLVELDPATAAMAVQNASASGLDASVVETSAEEALEYITHDKPVIFDPPRAGLHDKVVARVLDELPPQITYLSCNPTTQARDIAALNGRYEISYFEGFNFFPRTPHIETLAILRRVA